MTEVTCIGEVKDNKNNAIAYKIQLDHGGIIQMTPMELKMHIINKDIKVKNLDLTYDGKLVINNNKSEYIITRELINRINTNKGLSFNTYNKNNIQKLLLKASLAGYYVREIDAEVYVIESNNEIRVVSHHNFSIIIGYELFAGTDFSCIDLRNVNTSNCTDMTSMFEDTEANIINISQIDTRNVISMQSMFNVARAKNIIGIEEINTSKVEDIAYMFHAVTLESLNLSKLDTSKVKDMRGFLGSATIPHVNLNIDTSAVQDISYAFEFMRTLKLDISKFNTSNVTNMRSTFSYLTASELKLGKLNLDSLYEAKGIFEKLKVNKLYLDNPGEVISKLITCDARTSIIELESALAKNKKG